MMTTAPSPPPVPLHFTLEAAAAAAGILSSSSSSSSSSRSSNSSPSSRSSSPLQSANDLSGTQALAEAAVDSKSESSDGAVAAAASLSCERPTLLRAQPSRVERMLMKETSVDPKDAAALLPGNLLSAHSMDISLTAATAAHTHFNTAQQPPSSPIAAPPPRRTSSTGSYCKPLSSITANRRNTTSVRQAEAAAAAAAAPALKPADRGQSKANSDAAAAAARTEAAAGVGGCCSSSDVLRQSRTGSKGVQSAGGSKFERGLATAPVRTVSMIKAHKAALQDAVQPHDQQQQQQVQQQQQPEEQEGEGSQQQPLPPPPTPTAAAVSLLGTPPGSGKELLAALNRPEQALLHTTAAAEHLQQNRSCKDTAAASSRTGKQQQQPFELQPLEQQPQQRPHQPQQSTASSYRGSSAVHVNHPMSLTPPPPPRKPVPAASVPGRQYMPGQQPSHMPGQRLMPSQRYMPGQHHTPGQHSTPAVLPVLPAVLPMHQALHLTGQQYHPGGTISAAAAAAPGIKPHMLALRPPVVVQHPKAAAAAAVPVRPTDLQLDRDNRFMPRQQTCRDRSGSASKPWASQSSSSSDRLRLHRAQGHQHSSQSNSHQYRQYVEQQQQQHDSLSPEKPPGTSRSNGGPLSSTFMPTPAAAASGPSSSSINDPGSVMRWCHIAFARHEAPVLAAPIVKELVAAQIQAKQLIRAPWYRHGTCPAAAAAAAAGSSSKIASSSSSSSMDAGPALGADAAAAGSQQQSQMLQQQQQQEQQQLDTADRNDLIDSQTVDANAADPVSSPTPAAAMPSRNNKSLNPKAVSFVSISSTAAAAAATPAVVSDTLATQHKGAAAGTGVFLPPSLRHLQAS